MGAESGSKSKNAGLIAGITVGGLLLASVLAGLIIFGIRRRRRKVKKATEQSLPSGKEVAASTLLRCCRPQLDILSCSGQDHGILAKVAAASPS